jgi:hypothetical protein
LPLRGIPRHHDQIRKVGSLDKCFFLDPDRSFHVFIRSTFEFQTKENTMKSIYCTALALMLALAAAGNVAAKEKEASAAKQGGGMTMMDMMGKSSMSCMTTSDSLESLSKAVQEALKSDDKAKMKAALQQAEAHIAQMKNHMSMCTDMMNMMSGMMGSGKSEGGMMGGGMGGKMQEDAKSPGAEKKNEAAEHEKHHPK